MIMRVDEAGHHQLARSVNDFRAGVGRQVLPQPLDRLARDEDVGLRRLVDVAVMVVGAAAPDQNARRRGGVDHCALLPTARAIFPPRDGASNSALVQSVSAVYSQFATVRCFASWKKSEVWHDKEQA